MEKIYNYSTPIIIKKQKQTFWMENKIKPTTTSKKLL